jgi:hypothetical protein
MEPLVHSKKMEEIRRGGVGGGTPPAFPKGSAEFSPLWTGQSVPGYQNIG